jgi:predicted sugar kinase
MTRRRLAKQQTVPRGPMGITVPASRDHDVELDMTPFDPGTIFHMPKGLSVSKRAVSPSHSEVTTTVPVRLNAMIFDLSRMVPTGNGVTKSGSLCLGTNMTVRAQVSVSKGNVISVKPAWGHPLILHTALLLKRVINFRCGLRIHFGDLPYSHIGLASSVAVQSAVALAINRLFQDALSETHLIQLLAANYGEAIDGVRNKLRPGFSTGAGHAVAFRGGVVVVCGESQVVYRTSLPDAYAIFIALPEDIYRKIRRGGQSRQTGGESETAYFNIVRRIDSLGSPSIAYNVLLDLLPALNACDFATAGRIIWEHQFNSGKGFVNFRYWDMYKHVDDMFQLKQSADIVFVSSLGPAVAVISKDAQAVRRTLKKCGWHLIKETTPNNSGAKYKIG